MDAKKPCLSGAAKRKKRKEKGEREAATLKNVPLISQYFKFPTSSCSARKNVEEDSQEQEDEEERNSDENNNNDDDIRDFDAGENGQEQQEPDKDMELEVLHVDDDDHNNNNRKPALRQRQTTTWRSWSQ